jgi:hypothetical protein
MLGKGVDTAEQFCSCLRDQYTSQFGSPRTLPEGGSGLGRRQLWQDLLADLFEHVAGVARAVLEVQDDVIDADRA